MAAIGHPLLGDTLYGNVSDLICRQALHSYKIECVHPIDGNELTLVAELPVDLSSLI